MGVATEKAVANLIIGGRKLKANEYITQVEDVANKNVKQTLNSLGISLVAALERLAPSSSGKLKSTIEVIGVKELGKGFRLEIGFGTTYHDYIDKGVLGVEDKTKKVYKNSLGKIYQFKNYGMPPEALTQLEGWAKRNNIELEATQLQGKKKKIKKINSAASSLAYMIKRFGIEGRNYKARAIKEVMPKYQKQFEQIGFNSLILKVSKQ